MMRTYELSVSFGTDLDNEDINCESRRCIC